VPGRVFLDVGLDDVARFFAAGRGAAPDDGSRLDIAPGDRVAAVLADPARRLVSVRWGMIPMGRRDARGRPVLETIVNARSETVFAKSAFAGLGRCLLPVSGWYEWTGEKRHKTRWRITGADGALLAFAAVWDAWRAPGGTEILSLATLTCEPNADVAPVHHRMPVILSPERWPIWLGETPGDLGALLRPLEAGLLRVEVLPPG
jgi:putative SOS response-associated peptidase YedK